MAPKGSREAALAPVAESGNGYGGSRVIPAAPGDLEAAGLAVWEVAWSLPRVEPADCAMVEQLARLQDEAASLREALTADGMVTRTPIQSSRGEKIGEAVTVHPAVAMLRRIGREAAEVASELGLSPAGRRRLGMDVKPDEREPDWLDKLREDRDLRRARDFNDRPRDTTGGGA